MTDPSDYRVSDTERQRAAALLEEHFKAGRLDANEYEDRRGKALDAITRGELTALFTDLPQQPGHPEFGIATTAADAPAPAGKRARDTVMALLPFAALLLFFRTGSWLWFLVIPVGGILMYGPSGRADKQRDRDDRDDLDDGDDG